MKRFVSILATLIPAFLIAGIGPNVSEYKGEQLKWEEGSRDYFVMFKSLLLNNDPKNDTLPTGGVNPQADACMDPAIGSTFQLGATHIPDDAYVERAFLIWVAAANPQNLTAATDNSVTLKFKGSFEHSAEITSSVTGMLNSSNNFEFEGFIDENIPKNGLGQGVTCANDQACKTNTQSLGEYADAYICINGNCGLRTGTYTYRVDVTDFFKTLHDKGREQGFATDGLSLMGDYTVSNLDCYADKAYLATSGMVGGWSLVIVYRSEKINPKKIYIYNGLEAYQHQSNDINVSGFELPNEAEIRLTLFVAEGDPGLFDATKPGNLEGLQLHGPIDPAQPWIPLTNSCNPKVSNYYEIYNSISSVYGWNDSMETCIGNFQTKVMEYAMDVDTFLIKAKDEPYATHLHKGDQMLWLKLGANQDQIYSDLLVMSIDTKAPKFDIPINQDTPDGREKSYCSCAPTTEQNTICDDRPFYYLIKVQNWGQNLADNVTVKDILSDKLVYIPGSTEMTKEYSNGKGSNWQKISDGDGGTFPLLNATQIHEQMKYCDPAAFTCPDTVLIRFKVKPAEGLPKHTVIENTASITDSSGVAYLSNTSVPLRLTFSSACPSTAACPEPTSEMCWRGTGGGGCTKKEDCPAGNECVDGQCVPISMVCIDSATIERGTNAPADQKIIIAADSKNMSLGQFSLIAKKSGGDTTKAFSFDEVLFSMTKDSSIVLENIRLIHDLNGNGREDSGEPVIANGTLKETVIDFAVSADKRVFPINTLHHFTALADIKISGSVNEVASITTKIDGGSSVIIHDGCQASINPQGAAMEFATYQMEPTAGYFIVTKGPNDPEVPAMQEMNKLIKVMQVRMKAIDEENTVSQLKLRTLSGSVVFGQGIEQILIHEDTNNDGNPDGDPIASVSSFTEPAPLYTFTTLGSALKIAQGAEKYIIISLKLNLKDKQKAQIEIPSGGVKLEKTKGILELPVKSKEFVFACKEGDLTCQSDDTDDDDGCSISVVGNTMPPLEIVIALALMLGIFTLIRRRNQN